jgi:hypothetical protein
MLLMLLILPFSSTLCISIGLVSWVLAGELTLPRSTSITSPGWDGGIEVDTEAMLAV